VWVPTLIEGVSPKLARERAIQLRDMMIDISRYHLMEGIVDWITAACTELGEAQSVERANSQEHPLL
jgi:hypothetical protein